MAEFYLFLCYLVSTLAFPILFFFSFWRPFHVLLTLILLKRSHSLLCIINKHVAHTTRSLSGTMPIQYILQTAVSLGCLFSFYLVQLWDYNANMCDVFTAYFFSSKFIHTKLSLLGYACICLYGTCYLVPTYTLEKRMCVSLVPRSVGQVLVLHSGQPHLFVFILLHLENWDSCIGLISWTSTWQRWANYTRNFLKSYFPDMEGRNNKIVCPFSTGDK